MADDGLAGVNSMVSSLTDSINSAVKRLQAQQESAQPDNVQEFRKDVKKSSMNTRGFATDAGVLAKNMTRLNVISNLQGGDPADFYKFRAANTGEITLGQIGDPGVNIQVMNKNGLVLADSSSEAGDKYENFKSMMQGEYTLERGDYTIRVAREKGEAKTEAKNYALQLSMGTYTKDFDTVAKQPAKGENPLQMSVGQQEMLSGLNAALENMKTIPTGQTGTQKLMGTFNLFV